MRASLVLSAAAGLLTFGLANPLSSYPTYTASNTAAATSAITSAHSICQIKKPFARAEGRLFNYNGTGPRYFAGTNTWWLSHLLSDSDVELALTEIKEVRRNHVST